MPAAPRADRPYTAPVPLRWSDMDAYGHVNNVQFVRLLEEARIAALQDWFAPLRDLTSTGCIVARCEIEYTAPLSYRRDGVAVDVWVSRLGGSSFDLAYEICEAAAQPAGESVAGENAGDIAGEPERVVYARALTTMVWYDVAAARPRRADDADREVLARVLADPPSFSRSASRGGGGAR